MDEERVEIVLAQVMKERGMSKAELAAKAELRVSQIDAYCDNQVKRVDFGVLARMCYALDCDVSDLLRYVGPQEKKGK